jgi:hypothetical protein
MGPAASSCSGIRFSFSDTFGCIGGICLSYAYKNFLSKFPTFYYKLLSLLVTTKALSISSEGFAIPSSSKSSKQNFGGDCGDAMMFSNFLDSYFLNI